ncbi:MAG: patatin family protein [Solobacterium sp.]|jgi:predicted patatin/cPLA2 family phospholipase|nr:patatin family protein [Solobacterium sp.]MCH4223195.1 patatin family protein [Solobacterium sp.]MCH4266399.1 patatin family protein [Solobacterium sp.]
METYSKINEVPKGSAGDEIVPGCLVLEGGAWRGLYTQGVLDALMMNHINMQTTIGVSAGALSSLNYVSGQIGRGPRFNLAYRHDSNYCGVKAMKRDHGVTGFHYLYEKLDELEPFDHQAFDNPARRLCVTATDCDSGRQQYFEKGHCDIEEAVRASATVPYVSKPVIINGHRYLDGGIACKIPFDWALQQNFEKIIIVRTRDVKYRKPIKKPLALDRIEYARKYPEIMHLLQEEAPTYNILLDRIDQLEQQGRIFVIAPQTPVAIHRFEGDMEKLGELYMQGKDETLAAMPKIKTYLGL